MTDVKRTRLPLHPAQGALRPVPADSLHTVTTVYEVDRKDFPGGRTRRRKR